METNVLVENDEDYDTDETDEIKDGGDKDDDNEMGDESDIVQEDSLENLKQSKRAKLDIKLVDDEAMNIRTVIQRNSDDLGSDVDGKSEENTANVDKLFKNFDFDDSIDAQFSDNDDDDDHDDDLNKRQAKLDPKLTSGKLWRPY
ncbi:hypothetical protein SSS_07126 [Sarcoptes scabiei]|uniref:Uncharacterized protein n=1 Tax=Sarcoptes scabiei TaxID=52283 RepID=A0A834RGG3_SARSC|nr:hypothetical protein SSS_07126 [Sarcoptes scabiei]